jgi:hypothetical protein
VDVGTDIYVVERILCTETSMLGVQKAVVKWKGYPEDEATSELIEDIAHTSAWKRFRRKWKLLNQKGIFEVEKIVGRRLMGNQRYVRVQWAGTPMYDAEWIPESDLI